MRAALHNFSDERIWKRIQLNGMAADFSWKRPAAEYAKLYKAAHERHETKTSLQHLIRGLEERGREARVGRTAEDKPYGR